MTQKESKGKSQTVGVCKFCGQSRVYDYAPEDPDLEATRDCQCYDGGPWRDKEKILNAAEQNIDAIFGDHFPEVAEAFQALKENVYDGKIGRITIKLPGGATARLWMPSASAMKVDFKQTTVTELSTGYNAGVSEKEGSKEAAAAREEHPPGKRRAVLPVPARRRRERKDRRGASHLRRTAALDLRGGRIEGISLYTASQRRTGGCTRMQKNTRTPAEDRAGEVGREGEPRKMDAAHGEKLQVRTCHFCEEFRIMKELEHESREKWEKNEARAFDIKAEYKACLLQRTVRIWTEGEPRKTHAGDHLSKGFKLRFCPECGRRIQGRGKR